jgi:cell division septation protein DedD
MSTIRSVLPALLLAATTAVGATSAGAQVAAAPSKPVEAAITRARALLDRGDGAAARDLMDSLVNAQPSSSVDLVEALHWRAVMSESIPSAEKDWKRLLVEAPLAHRASDALLRLSELELLRGANASARQYAERVLGDHANSPNSAQAMLLISRAWFAENDVVSGCNSLRLMRGILGPAATEPRLQADELQGRCRGIADAPAPRPETARTAAVPPPAAAAQPPVVAAQPPPAAAQQKPPVTPPPATPPPAARPPAASSGVQESATGRYSVQLAAYNRLVEAEALVKRLATQGITARVDGTEKPFRVRTGRYATRADAARVLAEFSERGMQGFIAEITP